MIRGPHIAVVDDDPESRILVRSLLDDYVRISDCRIGTQFFQDGETFIRALQTDHFDIVFMDVYMKELDGAQCSRILRDKDPDCLLIFLTSSQEHMPAAFSCHAFEYIQKPFTKERFLKVLEEALVRLPGRKPFVEISCSRQTIPVLLENVCAVVSDAHYLNISVRSGENLRPRMKLSEFLDLVEHDTRFLIVNRGVAVNAEHVVEFDHGSILLADGNRYPVRNRDRHHIEDSIHRYHFDRIRAGQRQMP